jgi:putative addiction module killer protein
MSFICYSCVVEAKDQFVRLYRTVEGVVPFSDWVRDLRDRAAQQRIDARLTRLELGNFGDTKGVGEGVSELRIDFGPGYRVYFGRDGDTVVVLLCGGTKRRQIRDVELAKAYWQDYKQRK